MDDMDLAILGADFGGNLPVPNFARVGRDVGRRARETDEWLGSHLNPYIDRLGKWWNPAAAAEAEAEAAAAAEAEAAVLTRTSALPPEAVEETVEDLLEVQKHRDRRNLLGLPQAATDSQCNDKELDDNIANAQAMALGGQVAGGGRTKKKKRTKKRSKKRTKKKRSKKKRTKKR
jgi:hypothetical protein